MQEWTLQAECIKRYVGSLILSENNIISWTFDSNIKHVTSFQAINISLQDAFLKLN